MNKDDNIRMVMDMMLEYVRNKKMRKCIDNLKKTFLEYGLLNLNEHKIGQMVAYALMLAKGEPTETEKKINKIIKSKEKTND